MLFRKALVESDSEDLPKELLVQVAPPLYVQVHSTLVKQNSQLPRSSSHAAKHLPRGSTSALAVASPSFFSFAHVHASSERGFGCRRGLLERLDTARRRPGPEQVDCLLLARQPCAQRIPREGHRRCERFPVWLALAPAVCASARAL